MKHTIVINRILLVALFLPLLALAFLIVGMQNVYAIQSSTNIPASYTNTGRPRGIVALPNGNVWYVDDQNIRLVQYDPSTNDIVRTVGRYGTGEGEFQYNIYALTKDNFGFLYVLGDCRIYKLDSNGGFIGNYSLTTDAGAPDCGRSVAMTYDAYTDTILVANSGSIMKFTRNIEYVDEFGTYGSDNSDIGEPNGITTDANGRIYVAEESFGNRVQVFTSSYDWVMTIDSWSPIHGTTIFQNVKNVLVLDEVGDGEILVANQDCSTIEVFDLNGNHLDTWVGGEGYPFSQPQFLTKDSSNNIYVSEWNINAIVKYNSSGVFQSIFGNNLYEAGKFYQPKDLAYDGAGNLYVTDGQTTTPRVQEFTNDGELLATTFPTPSGSGLYNFQNIAFGPDGKLYVSTGNNIEVWYKDGNDWLNDYSIVCEGCWALTSPAFDSEGNLYAGEYYRHSVIKFITDNGEYKFALEFAKFTYIEDEHEAPSPDEIYEVVGLAVDTNDHIFISDHMSLKEFDLNLDGNGTPTYVKTLVSANDSLGGVFGTLIYPESLSINSAGNTLYLSDAREGSKIIVFSNNGTVTDTIGSFGGGQMQFYNTSGTEINPETGLLTIADTANGRVQSLYSDNKTKIINLIPSADVIIRTAVGTENTTMDNYAGESLVNQSWDPADENLDLAAIPARLMFGDFVVADFTVDLREIRDWSAVNVQTLPGNSKSLVVNLDPSDAYGISSEHSLYISRYSNQTTATVCPNATLLSQVVHGCTSGYTLIDSSSSDLTPVEIDGRNYWKIDNLTGTGAFSSLFETSFELSDYMTRQQISTKSNHEFTFGTSFDLNNLGDTMSISFSDDWDVTGELTVADLSLYNGAIPLPISDTPADDTWVVTFGTDPNRIIFTAPQNANTSTQPILTDNVIKVFINNEELTNPSSVDIYEISVQILSNGEFNNEVGSVVVPIVDSDTVNINGFVTSDLYFDLDTGYGETPMPAADPTFVDCTSDACHTYGDSGNGLGPVASNYTVDLGNLTRDAINKSGQDRLHTDEMGFINSIYFDLSTNAASGIAVTYQSHYGEMRGPGHNADANLDYDIPTTDGETDIVAGTSGYGIQLATEPVYKSVGTGTRTVSCGSTSSTYCIMGTIDEDTGENTQLPEPIYIVTGPIEMGRGKIDIAAAIDGTVVPGNYSDEITFIATSTF